MCIEFRASSNGDRRCGIMTYDHSGSRGERSGTQASLALVLAVDRRTFVLLSLASKPEQEKSLYFTVGGFLCLRASVKSISKVTYSFAISEVAGMIQESLDMEAQPIVPGNSNSFSRKQGKVFATTRTLPFP